MNIGTKVEFQIGRGSYGIGTVVAFNDQTEIVTVKDSDDGSDWIGPADYATTLE